MKILVVGDPHMKPEDLAEGARLIDMIEKLRDEHQPQYILFTGDLFHNHSLIHVEVMHFWRKAMERLAWKDASVIVLLGNHDGPHDLKPGIHALASLEQEDVGVFVIDGPQTRNGPVGAGTIGFLPFMRSNEEFVAAAKAMPTKVLYCHQEFNGCKYDNGFYSPGGVDPDAIPQTTVISGHIHMGQEFGKVWYVGAPRWMTISDANQDRFVWLVEHDATGAVVSRQAFSTDPACTRLVRVDDAVEAPVDPATMKPEWKVSVDITGDEAWVKARKDLWRGKARIRTFVVGAKRTGIRESEGIGTAFTKYLQGYVPRNKTPVDKLRDMARQHLTFS